MNRVAGIDSSTQSTKVHVYDADDGTLLSSGTAPHPDGSAVDPRHWLAALEKASGDQLSNAAAVSVAAQQHGMVLLDAAREPVHDALLWNDTRSADAARDLIAEGGGAEVWASDVGVVPVSSFTVTKLRWVRDHAPEAASRAVSVVLPHDYLSAALATTDAFSTDRGDASGTGYWSPRTNEYRLDLLQLAFGRELDVPTVLAPGGTAGETTHGALVAAGTGDNMGAALGLGLTTGDAVVSIGTSGTVFAVAESPAADPTGTIAGFADATGRYLPLVCTLNAARVLSTAAQMLNVSLSELDALALAATPGADGLTLVPYFDGERTPNVPEATGSLLGITRTNFTPQNVARAAVEGLLLGLAAGIDAMRASGTPISRVLLTGGGARSEAVRTLAADVFDLPVCVPATDEYVARGAARQAAWALSGSAQPPEWPLAGVETYEPIADLTALRARYADASSHFVKRS